MSTFRLIRGELQKILLRPLMYIITIVLVLGLIGSVILFNNTITDRQDSGYTISGNTKAEVYTNYLSNSTMSRSLADQKINKANAKVQTYATLNSVPSDTTTAKLKTTITSFNGELLIYKNNIQSTSPTETDLSVLNQNRANLTTYNNQLKSIITTAVDNTVRSITIQKHDYDLYLGLISATYNYLNSAIDTNDLEDHQLLAQKLSTAVGYSEVAGVSYYDKLQTLTNNAITDVIIDASIITDLNTKYTTATTYMTNLNDQMTTTLNDDKVSLTEYKNIALAYFYTSAQYDTLVEMSIAYYPVANFGDRTISNLIGYKNANSYEMQQTITRNAFLIDNNLSDNTAAYSFSAGQSYSNTASALDLVYFGLEICGFLIIVLCIVLVAGMVAGENARGTLRMQCLRPYSRRQILSSKIWATLILGFILLLFSAIVLFFAGWIMFGLDFTPILAVFNAQSAFMVSPIALIFIYLGLFMFKIVFYVMLATMIATLCKNEIVAILIPALLYVANAVLAFIFATTYWYGYVPFACVDLFKFFGGGYAIDGNPISIILSTPLFYNSSFAYSICMFGGLLIIMTIISHIRFKDTEIR